VGGVIARFLASLIAKTLLDSPTYASENNFPDNLDYMLGLLKFWSGAASRQTALRLLTFRVMRCCFSFKGGIVDELVEVAEPGGLFCFDGSHVV
jgi:hypothetical protein